MVRRCTNPDSKNYPDYGGRGITIHPDWLDLRRFISDIEGSIGPRPDGMSLDRVNNSTGNYVPGNVRWATPVQQANNKRPRIKNRDIRSLCEENARLRAELAELRDQTPVQLKLVG